MTAATDCMPASVNCSVHKPESVRCVPPKSRYSSCGVWRRNSSDVSVSLLPPIARWRRFVSAARCPRPVSVICAQPMSSHSSDGTPERNSNVASVILVPRRFRRRMCFHPFTVAAPSSVICSAKLRFNSSIAPAVFKLRSPRSEIRVSERSSRFSSFNCTSSGISESVAQLARRSTATGCPEPSRMTEPPARSIQPASTAAQATDASNATPNQRLRSVASA